MRVKTLQIVWHEKEPVCTLDFSKSGVLATGGADKTIKVAPLGIRMHPERCISLVFAEHRCVAWLVSLTLSAFFNHSLLIVSPSRSRSLLGHGSLHQVLGGAQPSPKPWLLLSLILHSMLP